MPWIHPWPGNPEWHPRSPRQWAIYLASSLPPLMSTASRSSPGSGNSDPGPSCTSLRPSRPVRCSRIPGSGANWRACAVPSAASRPNLTSCKHVACTLTAIGINCSWLSTSVTLWCIVVRYVPLNSPRGHWTGSLQGVAPRPRTFPLSHSTVDKRVRSWRTLLDPAVDKGHS